MHFDELKQNNTISNEIQTSSPNDTNNPNGLYSCDARRFYFVNKYFAEV